jgi:hypothetical protein
MANIPQREPVGDPFTGFVLEVKGSHLLSTFPVEDASVLHRGMMIVRYGIRFLEKPFLSIVPSILALDYGEMLTGEEMWTFILKKSNLYPRADVVGYRNDGTDEMMPIKRLDLAQPVEPLVYVDANATKPVAHPVALIAPLDAQLPPRLLEALPYYESLQAWEAAG